MFVQHLGKVWRISMKTSKIGNGGIFPLDETQFKESELNQIELDQ